MFRIMNTAALVGALATTAYAHGRIMDIKIGGETYGGYINDYNFGAEIPADLIAWSANNPDQGFVDPTYYGKAADMACHKDGKPGGGVAKIAAGEKVTVRWENTDSEVWPESHHGPVLNYMAKCAGDDCTSASASDLAFFKIDEAGLNDGSTAPGQWASDDLIAAGGNWEITIPESLAPGQYVLRHEIIALHSAQDNNGAQNYPQCINLEVTGSGSASPAGVTADQLYSADEAGIATNIYMAPVTYEMPGPAVWDGASSGGSSSGGSSSGGSSPGDSDGEDTYTQPAATSSVVAASPSSVAAPTSVTAVAAGPTGSYGSGSGSSSDGNPTYPTTTAVPVAPAAGPSDSPSAPASPETPPQPSQASPQAPGGSEESPSTPPPVSGNEDEGEAMPYPPPAAPSTGDDEGCDGGHGEGSFGGGQEGPHGHGGWWGRWSGNRGHWGGQHGQRQHARDIFRRV